MPGFEGRISDKNWLRDYFAVALELQWPIVFSLLQSLLGYYIANEHLVTYLFELDFGSEISKEITNTGKDIIVVNFYRKNDKFYWLRIPHFWLKLSQHVSKRGAIEDRLFIYTREFYDVHGHDIFNFCRHLPTNVWGFPIDLSGPVDVIRRIVFTLDKLLAKTVN